MSARQQRRGPPASPRRRRGRAMSCCRAVTRLQPPQQGPQQEQRQKAHRLQPLRRRWWLWIEPSRQGQVQQEGRREVVPRAQPHRGLSQGGLLQQALELGRPAGLADPRKQA